MGRNRQAIFDVEEKHPPPLRAPYPGRTLRDAWVIWSLPLPAAVSLIRAGGNYPRPNRLLKTIW